jgi:choline transporter-like protein 2/4/5
MRIQHHLSITAGPILTVLTGSSLITHGFFSVYGMCVDTLFLCFCE